MTHFLHLAHFQGSSTLQYVSVLHSVVWIHYISCICSSVDRYLSCFHLLAIITLCYIPVQVLGGHMFSLGYTLRKGQMLTTFNLLWNCQTVSKAMASFYISTNSVSLWLLHSLWCLFEGERLWQFSCPCLAIACWVRGGEQIICAFSSQVFGWEQLHQKSLICTWIWHEWAHGLKLT